MAKLINIIWEDFKLPLVVLVFMIFYGILQYLHQDIAALISIIIAIIAGSYEMVWDTLKSLFRKQFALDYIALLAIGLSIATQEFFVASIIVLMLSTGRTLEEYGVKRAKQSLSALAERIPSEVLLFEDGKIGRKMPIASVKINDEIFVRKGEVMPLDGVLVSKTALTDESSLTGEPYFFEKFEGDQIRSGTVNMGEGIVLRVLKEEKDSTYKKIVKMVQSAQEEKAPLVRLADRYSTYFTIIAFIIAGLAYFFTNDIHRVLAVLVIATPCPLILATPIALLGGVNASAKKRIIVKKLASLEALSRMDTIIFDKTGTITFGKPHLIKIDVLTSQYDQKGILAIAEAIERSSLHPFAKAIVAKAHEEEIPNLHAENIEEKIGSGISGSVHGKRYMLKRLEEREGMGIQMLENDQRIAVFQFEDVIKKESSQILKKIKDMGAEVYIYTGDKRENAEKVVSELETSVMIKAECTPEQKRDGIAELKKQGKITAMVGDGINDAPALALADVGMVFSNEEQTAASEAADIVFLGGDFSLVLESIFIARRTIQIAVQTILWGIGLSVAGMIVAAFGLIPPVVGAILQECIDIAAIVNALRASRIKG